MDHQFIDKLRHTLNNDVASRLLIKYFVTKGFDSFDGFVYPPLIYDLPMVIPEMADKLEVAPHARLIDPINDMAELGWNLFVLGNQRMYLGETYHLGLKQLATQLQQRSVLTEDRSSTRQTTPRRIINFIERVMLTHRGGFLNLAPRTAPMVPFQQFSGSTGMGQQFFNRVGGLT